MLSSTQVEGLTMCYPHILHHGAITGMTGSCHQLRMDAQHSLLVDCGLFQDAEISPEVGVWIDSLAIDFSLTGIKALVVPHVYIDHLVRIPRLLVAGLKGLILCSEPSAKLLSFVIQDVFKLGFSRDQQQVEHYLELFERCIIALPYGTWFTFADIALFNPAIRLPRVRHILGYACAEIERTYTLSGLGKRMVFSADLGTYLLFLLALKRPECADILIIENTYKEGLNNIMQRAFLRPDGLVFKWVDGNEH